MVFYTGASKPIHKHKNDDFVSFRKSPTKKTRLFGSYVGHGVLGVYKLVSKVVGMAFVELKLNRFGTKGVRRAIEEMDRYNAQLLAGTAGKPESHICILRRKNDYAIFYGNVFHKHMWIVVYCFLGMFRQTFKRKKVFTYYTNQIQTWRDRARVIDTRKHGHRIHFVKRSDKFCWSPGLSRHKKKTADR